MKRRFTSTTILLFILFATLASGYAQGPLDAYKYIIIPKKFDFLSEENKYRVNSTTKYLFDQNGFQTLMKGEKYPDDLTRDPCLALTANVLDESGMMTTKLYVVLLDCLDQEVFRSQMGKSKEKSYDKTYIYALNEAFVSFENMSYSFDPSLRRGQEPEPVTVAAAPVKASESQPVSTAATGQSNVSSQSAQPEVVAAGAAGAAVGAGAAAAKEESPADEKAATTEQVAATEEKAPVEETVEESEVSPASSYGNENVSFLLIDQGDKLVAYVSDNKNSAYKKGEMIGTLVRTSLPNVFRASWKNMDKDIDQTTAYFDDQGNLKIDVDRGGQIEVLTFKKE